MEILLRRIEELSLCLGASIAVMANGKDKNKIPKILEEILKKYPEK